MQQLMTWLQKLRNQRFYIILRLASMYWDQKTTSCKHNWWQCPTLCSFFCFVWFDSLHPINNLSIIKGRVFLGWTSTKLGLMFLLKDTTQWRRWGSNPRPFGLESCALPLSHCAPYYVLSHIPDNLQGVTEIVSDGLPKTTRVNIVTKENL